LAAFGHRTGLVALPRNHNPQPPRRNLDELLGQAAEWFQSTQHAFYGEMKKLCPKPNLRYDRVELLRAGFKIPANSTP